MTSWVIPVADRELQETLPLALESLRRASWAVPTLIGAPELSLYLRGIPNGRLLESTGQEPTDRVANTSAKLWRACVAPDDLVSDPFVWSADDIYLVDDIDLDRVAAERWVATGNLERHAALSTYGKGYRSTARYLRTELRLPARDYERHTPLLVHKEKMLEALAHGQRAPRSVYMNMLNKADARVEDYVDPKAFERATLDWLLSREPRQPWFSSGRTLPLDAIQAAIRT